MKKVICFDLEGPLSPQDHAYEVMKLVPHGKSLFEEISRYDDVLALKNQNNYQPGDTLKLIAPFLILSGITESKLKRISQKAKLVPGAKELIKKLKKDNWQVFIISTSYQQHAFNIAEKLGVARHKVFCTKFPLDSFQRGKAWQEIEVMGGEKKVEALKAVVKKTGASLQDLVVVGDSITDFKMLKKVKEAGGLAIVFNGNQYALPYGTVGVCSVSLNSLEKVLSAWLKGGKEAVKHLPQSQWLLGKNKKELGSILKLHQKFRKIVRQSAAKLG